MRWLLAAGSVLLVLVAAELGLRWLAPGPATGLGLLDPRFGYPAEHDPVLGYVPRVGDHGRHNVWHTQVRVTLDGLRSNGARPPGGDPILAVGDSFTWGDSVDDDETWPAHLERQLQHPVRNGGVFGYGFDQIVLRAERLVPELHPERLVVSFVANDVARCEQSYRYAAKPFFAIQDGGLVLRGVPVPEPGRQRLDPWRGLRWSRLADRVLGGLLGEHWWLPEAVREHTRGLEVGLLLVERLAGLDVPVLLVGQWSPGRDHGPARALLAHAARSGLRTLDLEPPLRRRLESGSDETWRLFLPADAARSLTGHMTGAGNAWVAERIARALAPASS